MKSIFLKILKIILILTTVVLGILLIFGLTLFLGWPWWVGFFILIGVVGLVLGIFFLKKLWFKRREQRFITQVIEQDDQFRKNLGSIDQDRTKEIQDRWKEAISALRHSHLKKYGNPLYVLPWYMIIGESGSGKTTALQSARLSSPFAEVHRTSGISGTRNCDWWFFEQAVVIDTAGRFAIPVDEGIDKEEWQKFLNLLAKYRRRETLNGLVISVAADKLLDSPAGVLEEDGKKIRQRIDELMRLLGAKFPVYVLVTKCDLIQGMNQFCEFCEQLSEKSVDQAMGFINLEKERKIDIVRLLDRVINSVSDRLRDYRLLIFSKQQTKASGHGADPALLLFPEEFERLKPGLAAFLNGAFQENPYQESPFLRGIYFSSGRQEGTPYSHFLRELGMISEREMLPGTDKGLFLHDFFARILPKDRELFVPTQRTLDWSRLTKNLGLTAWLAVGIAICGLLSYSFVKNLKSIRDVSQTFDTAAVADQDIYATMLRMTDFQEKIADISQKNRSWWLPRFGLHQNEKVEVGLKRKYIQRFRGDVLKLFDEQVKTTMAEFTTKTRASDLSAYVTHLVRRINLLKARMAGDRLPKLLSNSLPTYIMAANRSDPSIIEQVQDMFGRLYLYFLDWQSDPRQLDAELNSLQTRLDYLATQLRTDLHWLIAWADAQKGASPVNLQDFWQYGGADPDQPSVTAAYTAKGEGQIYAFLADLESALPGGAPTIARQRLEFESWYQTQYLEAWHDFGSQFDAGAAALKDPEERHEMASIMGSDQNPYFLLLDQMSLELQPLVNRGTASTLPAWARRVDELQTVREEARKLPKDASQNLPKPGILKKTAKKIQAKVRKLEKQTGLQAKRFMNPEIKQVAARSFLNYQQALAAIAHAATPRESAAKMAMTLYTEDPAKGEAPFFSARRAAMKLESTMTDPKVESKMIWQLVNGPLDFFHAYIVEEGACQLQTLWERDILREVEPITDRYAQIQMLLGADGIAEKFVQTGAASPFVTYSAKKRYHAKAVLGKPLPFEKSFLEFLNGRVSVAPTVADNYAVAIRGEPTHTNPNAQILPHATRLELQCGSGVQRLINRQYPVKKVFNWSPKDCGDVSLQILVGNLTLTQRYTGKRAFAEFLQDFAQGSRTFYPGDFTDQSAALKNFGIKTIKVGYRLAGHRPVIKLRSTASGKIPREIVKCENP